MNWSNKDEMGWRRSPPWHIHQSLGVYYVYLDEMVDARQVRRRYLGCSKSWEQAVALTTRPITPREGPVATPYEDDDMAKKKATAKKAGRKPGNGGTTVASLTEQFNALVPRAQKKGIKWAKHHSSAFGSREGAEKQLKRLQKELDA